MMIFKPLRFFGVVLIVFLGVNFFDVSASFSEEKEALYVFAAASLADAMTEIAGEFKKINGTEVYLNFAGSNTLRIQIEKGAPCDIFISANPQNVDQLVEKGFIDQGDRKDLLTNSLVVIAAKGRFSSIENIQELPGKISGYLSLADPQTVPAGIYAKEALVNAGVWDALKNSVAPALDVRAALAQIEHGNAEWGIVYRTDAAVSSQVDIVYELPQQYYAPILYPAGILKGSLRPSLAKSFVTFLKTSAAQKLFEKYGFKTI